VNFRAGPGRGGADRGQPGRGAARRNRAREPSVLSIKPFRRLWIALSLSSLGDWLSLVALASLASALAGTGSAAQYSAVAGSGSPRCCPRWFSARWRARSRTGWTGG